ncbi:MAG TPA: fumarylacetoacetate hydrolase family protein [Candidatus Binataceae bacterium]|jgi:2-keto-4-pentenoate hydratase/2-oxohepta-3-ene-1,7-dioic acid hydratase in catechol pathway|nr:fumarylacetoacetate hydrolase family protein [Candidatus Binataceae bacterium]
MKLLSFEAGAEAHVGVALADGIYDLTCALNTTHPELRCAASLLAIIQAGIDIDTVAAESVERLRGAGKLADYAVRHPKWLPPILRPPKILALALNYREHIEESKLSFFDEPIIFAKYSSNLVGHEGEIELPPFPQMVDEEHELALVVGRDCRHIRPSAARDYIFGYTICNDVSARDRQRERLKMGQPYSYAKNFASFCPMGPWVVTARELPDARNLRMEVRVNGRVRRIGNTSAMIFDPFEVLAYCSDYTLMEAGDVISLGTYAGNKRLEAGDVVEMETEGIGVLRNRVAAARAPWPNFAADKPTGPLVRQK